MIFKISTVGVQEYVSAPNFLKAIQGYCEMVGNDVIADIEEFEPISDETAKGIIIEFEDLDKRISMFDMAQEQEGFLYLSTTDV